MSLSINNSVQFKINELFLITKFGKIDLTNIFEELNLYDCLFLPVISGKILLTDAIGIYSKLLFDGSEFIQMDISKSKDSTIGNFKKSYKIYNVSDKKNVGLNAQSYILHFVSSELFLSDQQRVNQSYEMTYSDAAKRIITDYLKVPSNRLTGYFNTSIGIKNIVVPNLKPIEALQWMAKVAVDDKTSPNFLFFENAIGFNFATLSGLLPRNAILDIKFSPKNTSSNNPITDLSNARAIQIISHVDAINRIRSGIDSGRILSFDPLTGMLGNKPISYGDHFLAMNHGNPNPSSSVIDNSINKNNMEMHDSRNTLGIFGTPRLFSKYIKKNDPTSLSKLDDTENYKFQREAIMQNLTNKRIRLVMPGNFQLSSGFNINMISPNFSQKEVGVSNEDKSVNGKYIIAATRHIIGYNKFETIIEVATTSNTEKASRVDSELPREDQKYA